MDAVAVRLSVIVPTIGRETLAATLASAAAQLEGGDEVVVVGDGLQPRARALFEAGRTLGPQWRYVEHGSPDEFGNAQRNAGIRLASGHYLLFIDDDDIYADGALAAVRAAIAAAPGRSFVFKMDNYGDLLWRLPRFTYGDVGTPMFVCPNLRGALPHWTGSDYDWATAVAARHGEPVWREELVAIVRPHLRRFRHGDTSLT
jgi:glycosyltransferase involved in cell wall biosynthesis